MIKSPRPMLGAGFEAAKKIVFVARAASSPWTQVPYPMRTSLSPSARWTSTSAFSWAFDGRPATSDFISTPDMSLHRANW